MKNIRVTETVERIVHLTDENHIWIDDIGNIVFEEREHKVPDNPMKVVCTQCFFYNYTCANIPCIPQSRQDGKQGIWVKGKEGLK